jgi:hypothetical protein
MQNLYDGLENICSNEFKDQFDEIEKINQFKIEIDEKCNSFDSFKEDFKKTFFK